MGFSWGGFASGIKDGLDWSDRLASNIDEARMAKIRNDGLAEAKAARELQVKNSVRDNGISQDIAASPVTGAAPQPGVAPQTGQAAPDNDVAQTSAVATPSTVVSAPLAPPVTSPQSAADAAPARGFAVTPPQAPSQPTPDATAAVPAASAAPAAADAQPAPPAAPSKRFSVAGKGFDTIEEARAHADKMLPSMMDYQVNTVAPKMAEMLIAQGKPEQAQKWMDWTRDRSNQRHMEEWSKAVLAYQVDDFDTAARHLQNLHKDFPDGNDVISTESVKDKAGQTVGFNMRVKNDQTGDTTKQYVDARQLVEAGMAGLSPDKMFAKMSDRQNQYDVLHEKAGVAAAAAAAKAKAKAIEDDKKFERDKDIQKMKGNQRVEQITIEEQIKSANVGAGEKRKLAAKVDALKAAGYTDDQLNGMMPALVGAGDYKKRTSPEEARRLLLTERVKDPLFPKDPDAQKKIIDNDMQTIYGETPAAAKPATVPNPVSPAAPTTPAGGPAAAPQRRAGIPVVDSKTGKMVYLDPVTRKPIGP